MIMQEWPVASTLTIDEAMTRSWDAVVVGGGPAGSMSATELSLRGASVLLVDRCAFPRRKVCGCCVNGAALHYLRRAGLDTSPAGLGGQPLHELRLYAAGRQASLPLPAGIALSREKLDTALLWQAARSGASLLLQTEARLDGWERNGRLVELQDSIARGRVQTRVVLAAHGLGGKLLRGEPEIQTDACPATHIGAGLIVDGADSEFCPGVVFMACSRSGYVGLVRLEDQSLDVAAALDLRSVRAAGSIHAAVAEILRDACLPPLSESTSNEWRGTPTLTHRVRSVATNRLFVIGDAASYVEPFTGEGISWALATGHAVASIAHQSAMHWNDADIQRWQVRYHELLANRQRICRLITRLIRYPALVRAALTILSISPKFASPLLKRIQNPVFRCEQFEK